MKLNWLRAAVLVGFALFLLGPLSAEASGPCLLNRTYWFDGARLPQSQYSQRLNGTRANIEVSSPGLCGGGASYSVHSGAWMGLGNYNTSGVLQVGWEKNNVGGTNKLEYFSEWFECSPPTCTDHKKTFEVSSVLGEIGANDEFSFRAFREPSGTGKVKLQACEVGTNTCEQLDVGADPYDNWGWGGNTTGVAYAETIDQETDMPGEVGDKVDFRSIDAKVADNWNTYNWDSCAYWLGSSSSDPNCPGNPPRYNFEWVASPPRDHFRIWTQPL